MSSITPFTCLFCHHINPEGASFCNSCAAQLNLQPCLHCDAVDNRMATHCYKCDTPFPLHQMPEPDAAATPGALATAQTSPVLGQATITPAKAVLRRQDLTPTVIERSHEKTKLDTATAAAMYRGGWLMWGAAFLLVLLAVSAYLYARQPGKTVLTPETKPLAQMAPTAPLTPAAPAEAPQDDVVVTAAATPGTTAVAANLTGKVSKAIPPNAGSPPRIPSLPATDSETVTRRVPPLGNECVPALVTLGLCNPENGQEKP